MDTFQQIEAHLTAEEPNKALSILLSGKLRYPGTLTDSRDWEKVFSILSQISRALGDTEMAQHSQNISEQPDDLDALYNFAYSAYERRLHESAAIALKRCLTILPREKTYITELVSNLEEMMRFEEACQVLRDSGWAAHDSFCSYLLGYNSFMAGDLESAQQQLDLTPMGEHPNGDFVLRALGDMLGRARTMEPADVRDWHMAINGSVLLHLSPYGHDQGMLGRYALIDARAKLCTEGLTLVEHTLKSMNLGVPQVYLLADRGSQILGKATARRLGVPCADWPGTDPGLIAVYDLQSLEDSGLIESLREHRPGQVLWAHASCWTTPFGFAPDITTFFYQICSPPWEDTETTEEEYINSILQTHDLESFGGLESLDRFLAKVNALPTQYPPGVKQSEGYRLRQRTGSPIRSNVFT
jgi:hypothetical protein